MQCNTTLNNFHIYNNLLMYLTNALRYLQANFFLITYNLFYCDKEITNSIVHYFVSNKN